VLPAIRVENLCKHYRLGARRVGGYRTLRESIADATTAAWRRLRRRADAGPSGESLWALDDVSFAVKPGEVIGVIGRNGAGKSTLLKILSRITEPSSGRVEFRGRLSSLLEVGVGFHPELTGRENVFLNGALLGMAREEIQRKFDEIVAFTGLEQFLDTPVKRYSSGMYVRLAFGVAAHLESEILLVDEVLAVGDVAFQKKCLGKMQQISAGGRTVLFVSHNMPVIANLCSRCLLLEKGKLAADGEALGVIAAYNALCAEGQTTARSLANHTGRTPGSAPVMTEVKLHTDGEADAGFIAMNDNLEVAVGYAADRPLDDLTVGLVVKNQLQAPVFGVNNLFLPSTPLAEPTQRGQVVCRIEKLPLMPGLYSLDLYFGTHGRNLDVVYDAIQFEVVPADVFGTGKLPPAIAGSVFWPATWSYQSEG
jgi:lipopolysaccharide transport system ATP-binding protein